MSCPPDRASRCGSTAAVTHRGEAQSARASAARHGAAPADGPVTAWFFRPMRDGPHSLRWGRDGKRDPLSVGRAARSRSAGARVARLGPRRRPRRQLRPRERVPRGHAVATGRPRRGRHAGVPPAAPAYAPAELGRDRLRTGHRGRRRLHRRPPGRVRQPVLDGIPAGAPLRAVPLGVRPRGGARLAGRTERLRRRAIAGDSPTSAEASIGLVLLVFPAVLGASVRFWSTSRLRELDQVRLREREQLARELHDTVAHHVSAMVIRAQAGRVVAGSRPEAAVEALEIIEAEGSRTLAEMRSMVGALRERRRRRARPAERDRRHRAARALPGRRSPTSRCTCPATWPG